MKRVLTDRKWLVFGLLALLFTYAETMSAQSQGTGNRQFYVNHVPIKMVFVEGGEMS